MNAGEKERIADLIREARDFRLCGPSDDPDEVTAVTVGYHYLVTQLKRSAGPILPEAAASRLNSIEVDFNDIYSVYEAKAELDALLPDVELALEGETLARRPALSARFVNEAADVLAETNHGLSGAEIARALGAYASEFNVTIPHPTYPFDAPNKRTALSQNLMAFSEAQRYRIIRDLCDHLSSKLRNPDEARKLKTQLVTRYAHLDGGGPDVDVDEDLMGETRHCLGKFPDALALFNQALQKQGTGLLKRNLLDDMRLALEKLVQALTGNQRSLENQIQGIGAFIKERGGSPQLSNMFAKLVDYYCKYQNTYVKHSDAVIEEELGFVIEVTAAFMKHLARLSERGAV
ncbi:MAG TPA: hypothetical protein VNJ52_12070 [Patescibacteria group bacterium]|nr:hypothetical protein [Patescibacteria group bacterium]